MKNEKDYYYKKERGFTWNTSIIFLAVGFLSYNPIVKKDYARIADVENYPDSRIRRSNISK